MEEPCTTALALDPPQVLLGGNADSWRSVRRPPFAFLTGPVGFSGIFV